MKKLWTYIDRFFQYLLILPIRFYQLFISPLFPNTCRHTPTCSAYSIEAIKTYGVFRGSWMALKRITRCHPWGTYGYDPVPPKNYKFQDNASDD